MAISRRDLTILLPALAAGQTKASRGMPSKIHHSAQLKYEGNEQKKGRRFFYDANRNGFRMEMHETVLGPGTPTHDPHRHEHEEIVILIEGTLEAQIEGKSEKVEAGSVLYFGSNDLHTVRNSGTIPARYYVVELRGNEA